MCPRASTWKLNLCCLQACLLLLFSSSAEKSIDNFPFSKSPSATAKQQTNKNSPAWGREMKGVRLRGAIHIVCSCACMYTTAILLNARPWVLMGNTHSRTKLYILYALDNKPIIHWEGTYICYFHEVRPCGMKMVRSGHQYPLVPG